MSRPVLITLLVLSLLTIIPASAYSARMERLAGPVSARVLDVLDGDTVTVRARVWIGADIETHVRLAGIDAPEIHGKCASERKQAQDAKDALAALVKDGTVILTDIRLEKYAGRVLARVEVSNGQDVGKSLLDAGLVRAYGGGKRRPWCDTSRH